MQQIIRVSVVLLNVLWIAFFLTLDRDFSAFEQRRSSRRSDETFRRTFCLQPESEVNWTSAVPSVSAPTEETNSITELPEYWKGKISEAAPVTKISTIHKTQKIDVQPKVNCSPLSPEQRYTNGLDGCCFKFVPKPIKKNLITSFYMTNRNCIMPGAVLITTKGRHFCVDPTQPWVERIIYFLERNVP